MTEAEAKVMREHVAYWSGLAGKATAVVFGPSDVRILSANNPAIKSGMGFLYEVYSLPQAIARK